ncbi:MAG: PKD domain-containing protein [Patescibacteria group bacterium]|nr:PKD domain-containing protein [Patescibacteria group bacterium]
MKRPKNSIQVMVVLMLLVVTFAGCGKGQTGGIAPSATPDATGTIPIVPPVVMTCNTAPGTACITGFAFLPEGTEGAARVAERSFYLGEVFPLEGATIELLTMDETGFISAFATTTSALGGQFALSNILEGENYILRATKAITATQTIEILAVVSVQSTDITAGFKTVNINAAETLVAEGLRQLATGSRNGGHATAAIHIPSQAVQQLRDSIYQVLRNNVGQIAPREETHYNAPAGFCPAETALNQVISNMSTVERSNVFNGLLNAPCGIEINTAMGMIVTTGSIRVLVLSQVDPLLPPWEANWKRAENASVSVDIAGITQTLHTDTDGRAFFPNLPLVATASIAVSLAVGGDNWFSEVRSTTSWGGQFVEITVTIGPAQKNRSPVAKAGPDQTVFASTISAPTTVILDASASYDPDGNTLTYEWLQISGPAVVLPMCPPTCSIPPSITATFTPTVAGAYVFRVLVQDLGFTATDEVTITVLPAPDMSCAHVDAGPPQTVLVGQSVTISSDGTTATSSATFNHGWGTYAAPTLGPVSFADPNATTTTFVPPVAGIYALKATYENTNGSCITSGIVYITATVPNQPPTASITTSATSGFAPLMVDFTANCTDPDGTCVSYAWTFGDGSSSSSANPSHLFTTAGTYTVSLIVTDDDGATVVATTTITVSAPMPPTCGATSNVTSGSTPLIVNFTGICTPGSSSCISGGWSYGDGMTSSLTVASHTYIFPGSYVATYTGTDANGLTCTATVAITANNNPPTASITSSVTTGTTPLMVNFTANCTDSDGTCASYNWNFGDGSPTSSAQNPSHTFTVAGTYMVTLTVMDNLGAIGTATTTITVSAPILPTGPLTFEKKCPTNRPGALAATRDGSTVFVMDLSTQTVYAYAYPSCTLIGTYIVGGGGAIAVDEVLGRLYAYDGMTGFIKIFDIIGQNVIGILGLGPGTGNGHYSAVPGMAIGQGGKIFVLDNGNNIVQVFSPGGAFLYQSPGGTGSGPDQLNNPQGIALDGNGNVYIADNGNRRVVKIFATDLAPITSWGLPACGAYSCAIGTIAVDPNAGIVYTNLIPTGGTGAGRKINMFSLDGTDLNTPFAFWGTADGQMAKPVGGGMAVDSSGRLFGANQYPGNSFIAFIPIP